MEELSKNYQQGLDDIKAQIQESEELKLYLDEEESEHYKALQIKYEPEIEKLHNEVATNNPLQIITFEKKLLDADFEGLFLPRILGYSVVRGDQNENFKYVVPQDHFKNVLLTICNSSNFENLKQRIGQSIQMGFSLSSDIWITNLLNLVGNKQVNQFLKAQRLEKFRDQKRRHTSYIKFKKQFVNFNYQFAVFPETPASLKVHAKGLKSFLLHRSQNTQDNNTSLLPEIQRLVRNEALAKEKEYLELLMIVAMSYDLDQENFDIIKQKLHNFTVDVDNFENEYFGLLLNLLEENAISDVKAADLRVSKFIDRSTKGELSAYYDLMETVHGYGYVHEKSIEAIQNYYDQHPGLSLQNKCVRNVLKNNFESLLKNLPEDGFHDYFEMNKIFSIYMGIFSNEKFNQSIKHNSLAYVKRLLRRYTDKRGKDYQEIKKFVSTTFEDFGFMSAKEIKELFKTKRKKPASAS